MNMPNLPSWNAVTSYAAAFAVIAEFSTAGAMIRAPMIWHCCTVMMMMVEVVMRRG